MKLTDITSYKLNKEWFLHQDRINILGRKTLPEKVVDVDIYSDRRVSRTHARIWFENEDWFIQDLGSKHGTVIHTCQTPGRTLEIRSQEKAPLQQGDEILIGDTVLLFTSDSCTRGFTEEFAVDIDGVDSVNYSLIHSGLPVIDNISIRNRGQKTSAPSHAEIIIEGLARSGYLSIPGLEPGQTYTIPKPHLYIYRPDLEFQIERKTAHLTVFIESEKVIEKELWVLAFDEWSQEKKHWPAMAAFVLPNHPVTKKIIMESRIYLAQQTNERFASFETLMQSETENKMELALRAIYEYLRKEWHLNYTYEPSCFEMNSQKVRLPHEILADLKMQQGWGTCIDLSLLLAGCLEHLGAQPIVILLTIDEQYQHALVGCWKDVKARQEPLILERELILRDAIVVESTACTIRNPEESFAGADLNDACEEARRCIKENKFLFALDINTVRNDPYKITPLPFNGEPMPDQIINKVIALAASYSYKYGLEYIGAINLLLGLFEIEGGLMQQIMQALKIDPQEAQNKIKRQFQLSGRNIEEKPSSTTHYDQVLASAAAMAKRAGSPFIQEAHLLLSLLETPSAAVKKALKIIGLNQEEIKTVLIKTLEANELGVPFYTDISLFTSRL